MPIVGRYPRSLQQKIKFQEGRRRDSPTPCMGILQGLYCAFVQSILLVYKRFQEIRLKCRQFIPLPVKSIYACQTINSLATLLGLAKVGRRGSLVIPSAERRKAEIEEGDRVEVQAEGKGLILLRKVRSLQEIRKKMSGRLPQWTDLEGKADRILEQEISS